MLPSALLWRDLYPDFCSPDCFGMEVITHPAQVNFENTKSETKTSLYFLLEQLSLYRLLLFCSHSAGNVTLPCNSPHCINSLNNTHFGIFLKMTNFFFFFFCHEINFNFKCAQRLVTWLVPKLAYPYSSHFDLNLSLPAGYSVCWLFSYFQRCY